MSTQPVVAPHSTQDFMPLHGIDHVELWVGNARQAAHFYTRAFGFREVAYAGLETGLRDRTSHVLQQGRIRLVLTGALTPEPRDRPAPRRATATARKVIALSVPDAAYAYHAAVERGATGVREPWEEADEHGTVRMSTIAAYGETLHTFVERKDYTGPFLPGYEPREDSTPDAGLLDARPHRRQRRARPHEHVGQVLRGRVRDDGDAALLR